MSSIQNTVYYCCVSKGSRILYTHSCGDDEIENLAAMCLERTPPFHSWYFQTIRKRTFGYLMEDGYVYFGIIGESLGSSGVLQFLKHLRDEFKKADRNTKNGSKGNMSGLNLASLHEQLVPVIRRLITSLEHVSQSEGGNNPLSRHPATSPSPEGNLNCQIEVASSTKMPLLGKPTRQEKKKMKDRTVEITGGSEDHRRSTDRGMRIDVPAPESNNLGPGMSGVSARSKTSPQYARKMWWRQVRLILIIDAVICVVLFSIWLGICRGFSCVSG